MFGSLTGSGRRLSLALDSPALRALGASGIAAAASLACAWLIVHGHLFWAAAVCLVVPLTIALVTLGPAVFEGLLLILAMNGVPGIDVEHLKVRGSIEPLDFCFLGLIAFAVVRYFLHRRSQRLGPSPWVIPWSLGFSLLWLFDVVRAADRGVPMLKAALFGREFFFLALLLPFAQALFAGRDDRRRLLFVVGFFIVLFACGEILASVHAISPTFVHAQHALAFGSVTRIYARMSEAVALGFAMAFAYALCNSGRRAKQAGVYAAICLVAVIIQLTRIQYVGLLVGMLVAVPLWIRFRPTSNPRLVRRVLWIVGILGAATLLILALAPALPANSPLHEIVTRISQGVSNAKGEGGGASNTLAYREHLSGKLTSILGGNWVLGLGFLHPSVFYFPELPLGSIRNSDVGVLNIIMTMGAAGAILWYIPVLLALWATRPTAWPRNLNWIGLGAMIWLITVLTSSITLVTLFSTNGVVLVGVVMALVFKTASERDETASLAIAPGADASSAVQDPVRARMGPSLAGY